MGEGPSMAVCTTPDATCEMAQMQMDGWYTDNLALANNIGYMQRKYPGKKLRFMAVTSNMCNRTWSPYCDASIQQSSYRNFFADAPYPNLVMGNFYADNNEEAYNTYSCPHQIFSESITNMQA